MFFTIKKGLSFSAVAFSYFLWWYLPAFGINSVLTKHVDGTTYMCAFHVNQGMINFPKLCFRNHIFPCVCLGFFFRTMSNLYEDPDWSQKDLKETLKDARKHVLKNKFFACFAPDRLKYYLKELCQREQEGHQLCFTDLWGLIIETMLHEKVQ